MLRKEWSLIVNSLLVQFAVGVFLFSSVYHFLQTGSLSNEGARSLSELGITLSGSAVILGMIVSFFHLGNPLRAPLAVKNVLSSWLSREVVFTSLFAGFCFMTFAFHYFGMDNQFLMGITVLAGIIAVISMASIYYATGKPGWADFSTYSGFIGSVIILGVIGLLLLVLFVRKPDHFSNGVISSALLMLVIALMIKGTHQLFSIYRSKRDPIRSINNLASATSYTRNFVAQHKAFNIWGIVSSGIGATLLILILEMGITGLDGLLLPSLLLVLFGETLGRLGFYSLGLTKK